MKELRYINNVVTLALNSELCVGCSVCTQVCPHGVLAMNSKKAHIADLDGCMECGACTNNCSTGALSVTPGVGCASYIIQSWIKGKENASCGDSGCC
ncbi:MAG: 4Fe-4S dicluster domain-containing protein [Desulfobacteraceae bacterium]|nr:4Fe-4S dicluster domain-containing protein [Desulfobacteraceae bacterium]